MADMYNDSDELTRNTNKQDVWQIEIYVKGCYLGINCDEGMLANVANDLSNTRIAPLVRTRDHDDGNVVLKKMVFDRLPLNDAPLLPFTLHVYPACQASNPQSFNACLQRAA